jgi:hypothetical protein
VLTEALRGSLGWGLTGAAFGAVVGWNRGGVPLGLAAATVAALVGAMVGWVLGTAVGIADQWPISRMLARVLGGTFLGTLFGLHLLKQAEDVTRERKDLVAILWALAGAILGLSTSLGYVRSRPKKPTDSRNGRP